MKRLSLSGDLIMDDSPLKRNRWASENSPVSVMDEVERFRCGERPRGVFSWTARAAAARPPPPRDVRFERGKRRKKKKKR